MLDRLYKGFRPNEENASVQPRVITGGIGAGKTRTAIEYVNQYRSHYLYVFWVNAASKTELHKGFEQIAGVLKIKEPDPNALIKAIKHELQEKPDMLLILDKVEDLVSVVNFIPRQARSHILLTTSSSAAGTFPLVRIEGLKPADGAQLLFHRVGKTVPTSEEKELAARISGEMGGLPLAINQAGAYIQETSCGLSGYLILYQTERAELLRRHDRFSADYPESVVTTFSVSLDHIRIINLAAEQLLFVCAFLAPDAIPLDIITRGAPELGPTLSPVAGNSLILNATIATLRRFSLIDRDPDASTEMLSVHPLLQAVLQDERMGTDRLEWAKQAVQAVNCAFPTMEDTNWRDGKKYISHAQACLNTQGLDAQFEEAVQLQSKAGVYLRKLGLYKEAEPLLRLACTNTEKLFGTDHLKTATILNNLASLYRDQGKYTEAEQLYIQSFRICIRSSEELSIATNLHDLGELQRILGRYPKAKENLETARTIREGLLGPERLAVAIVINSQGNLWKDQGKLEEAEESYTEALRIRENILGLEHPDVAMSKNNLATIYRLKKEYDLAEQLYKKALEICKDALGLDHPDTLQIRMNLGKLYYDKRRYSYAEVYYKEVLDASRRVLGSDHPQIATLLNDLAKLYIAQSANARDQRNNEEAEDCLINAEQCYTTAEAICRSSLGEDHPKLAEILTNYAAVMREKHENGEAERYYQGAIRIYNRQSGLKHLLAPVLLDYADLLYDQNMPEAAMQYRKSWEVYKTILNAKHPYHPQAMKALRGYANAFDRDSDYRKKLDECYNEATGIYKQANLPEEADVREDYAYFLKNSPNRREIEADHQTDLAEQIRSKNRSRS